MKFGNAVEQLLSTKLHIPQLSHDLVARMDLGGRLDEVLRCKLTLISPPAGFGKSTLLAIQTIAPEIGVEAHQIIREPQVHSTQPLAISLINDISRVNREWTAQHVRTGGVEAAR